MQLIDRIKLAFHNLIYNKSRSLLTIIIVFVVSSLILIILLIGINFSQNLNKLQQRALATKAPNVYLYKYDLEDDLVFSSYFSQDDINFILEKATKYKAVNHSMQLNTSNSFYYHPALNGKLGSVNIEKLINQGANYAPNTYLYSFAFPYNEPKRLVEGRVWSVSDVNTNNVWVNSRFVNEQYARGKLIRAGDVIWLHTRFSDPTNYSVVYQSLPYVVGGIIDDDAQTSNIYVDLSYVVKTYPLPTLTSKITLTFYPPNRDYRFNEIYNLIEKFMKEVKINLEEKDKIDIEIDSELMNNFKMTKLISVIVIGLSIILSILIMLLSIGSVANTIIISVDKNKKFIGLLKAIGLKQKEVVNIVQIEAIITISIGVILSTSIITLNEKNFAHFLDEALNTFSFQTNFFNYQAYFSIPLYLPILVIAAFLSLALVFSRGSLMQIARMDVINIISEVS